MILVIKSIAIVVSIVGYLKVLADYSVYKPGSSRKSDWWD